MERTYKLTGRYSVRFSMDAAKDSGVTGLDCRWTPDVPSNMGGTLLNRYRKARNEFMAAVADQMGLKPEECLIIEA